MKITKTLKNRVFKFLTSLREGGEVNMFGAVTYLVEDFDLDRETAADLLAEWMQNFKEKETI